MSSARYVVGDVRAVLADMPEASVDLVLTSPPFLALRSYLPADHPDKHLEIGSEPTPGQFIDTLLDVVEACARVLAPHGSMCIELGDTYSGSGGAGGDYNAGGLRAEAPKFAGSALKNRYSKRYEADDIPRIGPGRTTADRDGWPLDKSLCLIPEIFRFSLVYGFNPLTGRATPRWRARNVVRWVRPNPPVGALGDKFRPATSEMVVICKNRKRYFDLDAVRTEPVSTYEPHSKMVKREAVVGTNGFGHMPQVVASNPAGAPPLDWWKISTQPYTGSHYATWPEQLCITPVKSMCPLKVCTVCGKPSERIVSEPEYLPSPTNRGGSSFAESERVADGANRWVGPNGAKASVIRTVATIGWTDCGHNSWRAGVTLDPFAGSGTTLAVATGHGRDAIGIDLDESNANLALGRVGPLLLTIEHHTTKDAA